MSSQAHVDFIEHACASEALKSNCLSAIVRAPMNQCILELVVKENGFRWSECRRYGINGGKRRRRIKFSHGDLGQLIAHY